MSNTANFLCFEYTEGEIYDLNSDYFLFGEARLNNVGDEVDNPTYNTVSINWELNGTTTVECYDANEECTTFSLLRLLNPNIQLPMVDNKKARFLIFDYPEGECGSFETQNAKGV